MADGAGQGPGIDVRFAPSARFPQAVATYWEVHGQFPHVRERVLPTGDLFVLVNLGAPHLLIGERGEQRFADAWVSGIQRRALVTGALGRTDVWGAKLTPPGARLAFGSAAALAGEVAEFGDVLGGAGRALAGRMRDCAGFAERCLLFDDHLAKGLAEGWAWRPEMAWAMRRLTVDPQLRIRALASELGWSRKHLHAQFVGHVGHPPKTVARIARFERALRAMTAKSSCSLAHVAAAAGYYDQAQFSRDFRSLAGITPAAYLRSRVAGADYGFVDADG